MYVLIFILGLLGQLVKCLSCKDKDLNLFPRPNIQNPGIVVCVCYPRIRKADTGVSLDLSKQ